MSNLAWGFLLWSSIWLCVIAICARAHGVPVRDKLILIITIVVFLYLLPIVTVLNVVHAQLTCFEYGQTLSCDGPNLSNRSITRFNDRSGIMTDERGNLEPYTILPRQRESRRLWEDDDQRSRILDDDWKPSRRRQDDDRNLNIWEK